jgi:Tfp pilus assembly protein PilZ
MLEILNRRQNPRQACFIIAEYKVIEGVFHDVVSNIGAGGLFIRTDRMIAVGQSAIIEFPLMEFDNIIQVTGKIVRKDINGFAVTFDKMIHGLVCKDGLLPVIVPDF